MQFHQAYQPTFSGNAAMMIQAAIAGMDSGAKRRFAATLDLQEPVARLLRFEDPRELGSSRSMRGQLEMSTTISILIRMGDSDLIQGALLGPRATEPKVYHQSRDFADANDDLSRTVLKEALAMSDLSTLALAHGIFKEGLGTAYERGAALLGGGGREFGSALYGYSSHADARPYADVLACAKWLLARHGDFVQEMHRAPARESKAKAAARVDAISGYNQRGVESLLDLAIQSGSEHLAKAALELGAKPDFHHAWGAFDNGAPALASALWKLAQSGLADGSLDCQGPKKFDLGRHGACRDEDGKVVMAAERRSKSLSKMGESLESLRSKVERQDGLSQWDAQRYESRRAATGNFVLEVLLESIGEAKASDLAAPAAAMSHRFEGPAKWIRSIREAYPRPFVAELGALARSGKWALVSTRLADAAKARVSQAWREEAYGYCARATQEISRRAQDEEHLGSKSKKKMALGDFWSVKLACELSVLGLGWRDNERPIDKIKALHQFNRDEIDELQASFESQALSKQAAKAEPSSKGSLRV